MVVGTANRPQGEAAMRMSAAIDLGKRSVTGQVSLVQLEHLARAYEAMTVQQRARYDKELRQARSSKRGA